MRCTPMVAVWAAQGQVQRGRDRPRRPRRGGVVVRWWRRCAVLAASRDGADYGPGLLPHHERLLRDSAIAPEVARARGYRSITTKAEAEALGFKGAQANVQYTPLYQLLPLATLRRFGLPALGRHGWPYRPYPDHDLDASKIAVPTLRRRLQHAVAHHVWPLLC